MNGKKVLVLDGRTLSCLAFVRSLGSAGAEVHVGEDFNRCLSFYSRHTKKRYVYPSAKNDPGAFRTRLLDIIESEQYDFVVPTRDITTGLLADLQAGFPETTKTLLSTKEKFDKLSDKKRCTQLAESIGISVPKTYYPTETGLDEIAERAEFPVLIKPTVGSGSRGIVRVEKPEQLTAEYESVTEKNGSAIIQEFVDHSGGHFSVGTVFDHNSEPRALHVYEELVQYPDSGGPAIEAVSVDVEPWVDELLDILREVDWVGPAHMDVLFDPEDETYKLLEVNPRIWMSIGLTIRSGVDIPKIAWWLANSEEPDSVTSYRVGLRYRWVLPNQLLWAASRRKMFKYFKQVMKPREEPTCYGVLSKHDGKPMFGVITQSIIYLLDKNKRKQVLNRNE